MEIKDKHVSGEALSSALEVVKDKMPKPGAGLRQNEDGTWAVEAGDIQVNPDNVADATATSKGVVQVGPGLKVAAGVVSTDNEHIDERAQAKVDAQQFKTVNGQSIKGTGDITIDLSLYKVVDTLPTSGIDANKIYLVRNAETVPDGELNVYTEYMRVGNAWEKVGEYKSAFDPTDLKALIQTAQDTADAAKAAAATADAKAVAAQTAADKAQAAADTAQTAADKANTDIAGLEEKYPNLKAILATTAYVDNNFVKRTDLEAACMTAEEGKALADSVFA